jgi:4-hydroxybutyryl-CoA dehydratase/vinylacetyl-CoA-Delta-isomerase
MPSQEDFEDPQVGPALRKYLSVTDPAASEARRRLLRLLENLTLGPGAAAYLTESLHGAGSPQAQRIMLARLADLDGKVRLAEHLAGVSDVV